MTIQLRPLGFGEMLDQTFNVYRRNFGLFFGVSILPPIVALLVAVGAAVLAVFGIGISVLRKFDQLSVELIVGLIAIGLLLLVVYYTAMVLSRAASIKAVSEVYLGRPTTISASFSTAFARLGPLTLITLLLSIITFLPMMVPVGLGVAAFFFGKAGNSLGAVILGIAAFLMFFAAIVFIVFIFLRYLLAVPACVIENCATMEAFDRSVGLMRDSYFKAFGILFLLAMLGGVISMVLTVPTTILTVVLARTSVSWLGTVLNQLVQFAVSAFLAPLITIATALIYYDARIRKEAFDIEHMMREADGGAAQNQAPTPNFG